jgi:iron(III) transport system substrate-binding protein
MLKKFILAITAITITSGAVAAEVNVYSARKEVLIKPLLDNFTEQTGIKVRLLTGKADALLKRLEAEGSNSPADLFITTDAGRLHRAKAMNLLQSVESDQLAEIVPESMRDRENFWYGLSIRSRPIMYAKDRVQASELSTYEDLTDPRWKGRICIRSSGNIYNQSLLASMLVANGKDATSDWAKGLVANFARPPAGGDTDQIKMVAAGLCDIAIANTYYLGKLLGADDQKKRSIGEKVSIFWPNQSGRGAHVNVSGAGVTAASKNKENAIKLLEHLVSKESQAWYAQVNFEYPVREGVEASEILKSWGDFKPDTINLTLLGENNPEAVKIMDRAGWR